MAAPHTDDTAAKGPVPNTDTLPCLQAGGHRTREASPARSAPRVAQSTSRGTDQRARPEQSLTDQSITDGSIHHRWMVPHRKQKNCWQRQNQRISNLKISLFFCYSVFLKIKAFPVGAAPIHRGEIKGPFHLSDSIKTDLFPPEIQP